MTQMRIISITTGNGPEECCFAAKRCMDLIIADAQVAGVQIQSTTNPSKHGIKSASLHLTGNKADQIANQWIGSILWTCPSPFRPSHRRQNWYIGVMDGASDASPSKELCHSDVTFETFRAGGPGGQHQNKTDSAVRVIHRPSGLIAIARDGRSQHRNKARALERLKAQLLALEASKRHQARQDTHAQHQTLERGNAKRHFKGPKFREVS